jgi:dCTP deaminase
MILSDNDIKRAIESENLKIQPLSDDTIQQNGVDFRVSNEFAVGSSNGNAEMIDGGSSQSINSFFKISKCNKENIVLEPLKNYLLTTQEQVKMPNDLMGFCGLRSTFARLGFVSPLTIVDAGFEGTLTIGVFYGGSAPIKIPIGCRFLHVVFAKLLTKAGRPYQGTYKGKKEVSLPKALV